MQAEHSESSQRYQHQANAAAHQADPSQAREYQQASPRRDHPAWPARSWPRCNRRV